MTTLPRRCRLMRRRAAPLLLLLPVLAAAAAAVLLPILPRLHAVEGGSAASLPLYAASFDALAREARDATVERLLDGFAVVAPKPFAPPTPATDERFGGQYSRAVFVYAPPRQGEVPGLFRRVVIHHEPETRNDALRAARLVARLMRLHRQRFHRDTVFLRGAETADIWFAGEREDSNGRKIGGETHGNQMYIFATGTAPRTALEGVRTLAHEWGHATLPGARGYTEPENDAAGYLGERLYLKWLYEDKPNPAADDGTRPGDLKLYYQRQVGPLIARFQTPRGGGPYAKAMSGTFTEDMDYYIGMALACDDAFGSVLLGKAMFSINGVEAADFRSAFAAAAEEATMTVRLPAWVPLQKGRYTLWALGNGRVALADRPPLSVRDGQAKPLQTLLPGWKWVRKHSGSVRAITLRRASGPR